MKNWVATFWECDFSNYNRCNNDYVTFIYQCFHIRLRTFNFRLHVPLLANRMWSLASRKSEIKVPLLSHSRTLCKIFLRLTSASLNNGTKYIVFAYRNPTTYLTITHSEYKYIVIILFNLKRKLWHVSTSRINFSCSRQKSTLCLCVVIEAGTPYF